VGDTYPTNANATNWLRAYIPKAPEPPGRKPNDDDTLYQYAQLGNGGSYAIWDPNSYGGKVFAAGPGGAIGEGEGENGVVSAINKATGLTLGEAPDSNPLDW
jgi:hypothetical protein